MGRQRLENSLQLTFQMGPRFHQREIKFCWKWKVYIMLGSIKKTSKHLILFEGFSLFNLGLFDISFDL